MQIFKEFYNSSNKNENILDVKIPDRVFIIRTSNMWDYDVQSNVYFFGKTKQVWPIFVSAAVGLLFEPKNESRESAFKKVISGQYSLGELYSQFDNIKTKPNYSIDDGFANVIKGKIKEFSVQQAFYLSIEDAQQDIISAEEYNNGLRNDLLTETNPDDIQRIEISIEINDKEIQLKKMGKPFSHTMLAADWSQNVFNTSLPSTPIYQWIEEQTRDGDPLDGEPLV